MPRLQVDWRMRNETILWVLLLCIALAGTGYWYFHERWDGTAPELVVSPQEIETETETEGDDLPQHPLVPAMTPDSERPLLRPLPPLDDSDEYFRMELSDLFGEDSESFLVRSGLVERVVATIDNLPRQRVSERIRPLSPLVEPFAVQSGEGNARYTLDPENYRRYDTLVATFTGADLQQVTELYRRYYPLLQKAYEGLGYPDGYFNDRLVEVIDHLLDTPAVEGPIELERPHVLYEFADPDLEALSGGQKLMLRLGPDNRRLVEARLRDFRSRIAKEN